jgi:hypothetical protein
MNAICRKIWDRDMTVRKWSEVNGFNLSTVRSVLAGQRGSWGAGVSKKIFKALVDQGLMTQEEADARIKP